MGELMNLNPKVLIADTDIPAAIARDAEVSAAISAHLAGADPHPIYLTQGEGDARYRQSAVPITDADIPAAIARDAEVSAAISAHLAGADPHPIYLTQAEGDARYANFKRLIVTGNCPAGANQSSSFPCSIAPNRIIAISAVALALGDNDPDSRFPANSRAPRFFGISVAGAATPGTISISSGAFADSFGIFGCAVSIAVDYV